MSKFVIVNKSPANLGKGEIVLSKPNFLLEIQSSRKGATRNLTALNQLRDILLAIEVNYGVNLNVPKIPFSLYEGLSYSSDEELNTIITSLLNKERPDSFEDMLEYNIKTRPYGTKLIYYVGRLQDTGPFFRNGIDMIDEANVDEYLGRKPKKGSTKQAAATAAVSVPEELTKDAGN